LRQYQALRNLWLGRAVSLMGDWFNLIALYQAVQSISDSARALVLVVVAKTLPAFFITPLAGPLIDRVDRRTLLVIADIFRALCALGIIAAYLLDSLLGLYACTVLMICGTGISVPATSAALPMIVPAQRVPMANALLGGTWSVSLAGGAALGGAATEFLGVTAAFAIDGATFVVSALFAWRLPRLPAPGKSRDHAADTAGFVDGLRYLRREPYILSLTGLKSLMQLYGGLNALTPIYGTLVFASASGPLFVGLLFALRGIGAAIGALATRAIFGDDVATMRRIIAASFVLGGASFAALAFCTAFWQACLAFFLAAIGQSAIWVYSGSLLQIEAEPRYHGRVFSLEFGVMTLILASSSFSVGTALDHGIALRHVVSAFAALSLIPIALWTTVVWRKHARKPRRSP
jgi:predicted MFS family arabinose efflux permease